MNLARTQGKKHLTRSKKRKKETKGVWTEHPGEAEFLKESKCWLTSSVPFEASLDYSSEKFFHKGNKKNGAGAGRRCSGIRVFWLLGVMGNTRACLGVDRYAPG